MDRFRECIEAVREKWRDLVKRNWHNQPEGDNFRLFDVVLLVGAVRTWKLTAKWKRYCWNLYRFMAVFHLLIASLDFIECVANKSAFGEVVWFSSATVAALICFIQQTMLNRFFESIQSARDFINGKPANSGDKLYDAKVRKRFFQRAQLMAGTLLVMACLDELIPFIPNSGVEKIFRIPLFIRSLGPRIAQATQFTFTVVIWPVWICKRLGGTSLMCSLILGYQTELDIFVHGFDGIWDRVQLEVEENLPLTSSTAEDQPALVESRRAQREELFWKYLNQQVGNHIEKHLELLENLQSLGPAIEWLFFVIYYNTLGLVAPAIYVMQLEGLSVTTAMMTVFMGSFIVECYLWCYLIESFQDINDELEISIMDLVTKIPYSSEHHADYKGMLETLMIMKMNVRNSCQFSCGGVFNISVEVTADLLDLCYSVFTFLRDFGNLKA